ncbi:TetR/AcrR family transcriptional regulator C-terminal domain-containing protein [Umezawaea sp. Da 62-37]|uniref:TetR/AcrR family transcriptional regulator C-terminal domain-containing protein n=1 Tax=Umezawaea sp. Da 62-37 TaxID=3075927 RepID=UPI0028F740AD|nr:TetR/AcrR family transcriptional regulator C-terminal domain-containing protein [Umezawaea sp. Da 62-37]WNV92140.1 TetR/AcrR family transcriptional regulator C-terminal domain-containing protein [Umezawaea sp. Da 62-37]
MVVWERAQPPTRPTPTPLSREGIVRAAIALADADGLDAVSLRKVAAALDAGPMRLYGYLATKAELLDLMVDEVYGEMIAPPRPPAGNWRDALRDTASRVREAALRHEWFADLLGGRPRLGPHALEHTEMLLAALRADPGFGDIDTVMSAVRTANAYVFGALRSEVTERRAERATGLDERQWQQANGPYLVRVLATGRYPVLSEFVHDGTNLAPGVAFADGLDQVLDGIAVRLAR